MELTLAGKKAIVDFLVKVLEPQIIYLYGSFARAEGRVDSDIDIAIYTETETDPYKLFLLANQLAMLMKRDVELVDLRQASTVFRAQIVSSGEALFYQDKAFKENYEVRALKEYAKLNEERSAILEAVREGGSVRNKIEIIERCLTRIGEVYASTPSNLSDFTKQDSIVLNLQRAVEATIDIAMFVVSAEKLGLPQSSRDSFEMLYRNKFISETLLTKMSAMVGFRNIVVHNYQKISLPVLQSILEYHLGDFHEFIHAIKRWA